MSGSVVKEHVLEVTKQEKWIFIKRHQIIFNEVRDEPRNFCDATLGDWLTKI